MTSTERTAALWQTRQFLLELSDSEQTPSLPRDVRLKAQRMLAQYPDEAALDELALLGGAGQVREQGVGT